MPMPYEIPFKKLVRSPLNPRTEYDDEKIRSLAESIRSRGLLMPLVVHSEGEMFGVIDGERRRRALEYLEVDPDHPVLCVLRDANIADALVLNGQREAMSVADQIIAVGEMARQGMNASEMAAELGTEPIQARRFMAVSSVPRPFIERFRSGHLTFDAIKDLSQAPEIAASLLEEYGDDLADLRSWDIITAIRGRNSTRLYKNNLMIRLLGEEVVEAEYGGFENDLFGDDDDGWAADPEAVIDAVNARMKNVASKLEAENWKDVVVWPIHEPFTYSGVATPWEDTHDNDEEDEDDDGEWPALTYSPEARSVSTVYVILMWPGKIITEARILKASRKEAIEKGVLQADSEVGADPAAPGWSGTGMDRLHHIVRAATASEVAGSFNTALCLAIHAMQPGVYYSKAEITTRDQQHKDDASLESLPRFGSSHHAPLSLAEIQALKPKERNDLFAQLVAATIPVRFDGIVPDPAAIRKCWTPDGAWLGTMTKQQLVEIASEIGMGQGFIDFGKAKKGDLVPLLEAAFAGNLDPIHGTKAKDVYPLARTWLPAPIRTKEE